MATYTSNYNLSKPESTDSQESFISAYRDNMNIIDKQMGNKNIAEEYDNTQTYAVDDYVIYDGDLYKCTTAVTSAEDFDSNKWTRTVASDEFGSGGSGSSTLAGLSDVDLSTPTNGQVLKYNDSTQKWENANESGGSGSLDAVETTSNAYAQLPQTDKDDPTKIYFLNDTQSSEIETSVDFSSFVNATESSTTISVVNDELVYTWNGGSNIKQNSYYPTAIPASVKKIKYKLTTGSSSYYNNVSANARWQICVGVKASYSTADIYPTDSNWLVNAIYNTVNDVIEGELDLSSITSDCYLMICAKGWNLTWNEISTVEDSEPTGETKIKYKDITYGDGNGGGGGGSTYVTLFDNQTTTSPATITLNDAITNYDQIQFQLRPKGTDAIFSMIYDVADLVVGDTIGAGSSTNIFVWYYYTDATTLTLRVSAGNVYMSKIVGIKHCTGGGSGGLTKDVIYQNSGSSIPSTITLDHGISEYDMIVLSGYRSQYPTYWASKTYLSDECVTNRNIGLTDDAMYAWYTVTNDTTLTLISSANMVIDKIYGLKY